VVGSSESLESVAFSVCEAARQATGRKSAVVLRDPSSRYAEIASVSHGGDRRLMGSRINPESAAGKACMSDVPIGGATGQELFGQLRSDRRRQDEAGTAFPLRHNAQPVGALIVFGRWDEVDADGRARLMEVASRSGPRLGGAVAARAAELQALTDELTGLWNRRALDGAMRASDAGPCTLLLVGVDGFKAVHDQYGSTAGDAALRHVATVLKRVLRGDDVAARVGGEGFALWLPGTPRERAMEVAERVRKAVAGAKLQWAGSELELTCSIGVATKPEVVEHTAKLYAAADAALHRAREAGRNRVQIASAG
jgi:diguanylate cyclase (GGDEF)-like protein